ncbi:recombinase family protein [Micrococcus luteus]|uniref:recombinase family protein n=1 Tax=Micrococcus luteus TaxID=1270 RepID=UPI0028A0342D|nr:recombinase family protein [Micrococcus luteus]MCV7609217.1 recombinase family protein [Micrococcus luteus]
MAYVRVSSAEQNLERQLEAVGECDRVFQDKISGSSRAERTGLAELMRYVREGDLVKVASMDRLGRDTRDLYAIVDELTDKGCAVQFVSERITVDKSGTSPVDGLMLGILAAFAEFERRRIKERQAEGIALAKARGKYVQAPKMSDQDVEQARVMIDMGIPKAEVARTFGVSRQTLYTSLKRAGEAANAGCFSQSEAAWVSFRGQDAAGAEWDWCTLTRTPARGGTSRGPIRRGSVCSGLGHGLLEHGELRLRQLCARDWQDVILLDRKHALL